MLHVFEWIHLKLYFNKLNTFKVIFNKSRVITAKILKVRNIVQVLMTVNFLNDKNQNTSIKKIKKLHGVQHDTTAVGEP